MESIGLYYCIETGLRRVITVGIEDQFMHEDIVWELSYNPSRVGIASAGNVNGLLVI